MKRLSLLGTLGGVAILSGTGGLLPGTAYALSFIPPAQNSAPQTSTGGASRGGFIPPAQNSAPQTSTGGASRGGFTPPSNNATPQSASGGASRGGFIPPSNNATPQTSTGGASRGGFTPPSNNATPQSAAGGASRGGFTPPSNNATPQSAAGGASRTGFTPPSDNAAPRFAASASSRTNVYGYLPSQTGTQPASMLAITPQSFYGTTLMERPTFLVYVPSSNAQEAVFSLKDEAGKTVYQTLINVPTDPGVVAIQLPEDAPELIVGQNYQWFFALMVNGTLSPSTPYVDAWVKRIAPDAELAQILQQDDSHQRAELLATKGVWYDSVAMLTDLQVNQPTNLSFVQDWHELLDSVGLQDVTAAYTSTIH